MAELTIQKRRSGTISGAERITGVKNAQAEMILSRRIDQYQNNFRKSKLKIQLEEYKLGHEARLLTLDHKVNDLEYKKRLYPYSDLSHEEMTVQNLQKYLVSNTESLCYLEKKLGHSIRNQTSGERIPTVVSQARMTIRRNQILKELEEARMRMYSFLRPDGDDQRDNDSIFITEIDEVDGELDKAMKQQVVLPEIPDIAARPITTRKKTINQQLKENPIVREAFTIHEHQKREMEATMPTKSPTAILARMARVKPPTKTEMMEEVAKVQDSVEEFNTKIDDIVWNYKQEEFQQGLKFVKDKDGEWNKFMEKMNKRNRGDQERPQTTPAPTSMYERRLLPYYEERRPLTQRERRELLMENLLRGVEKQSEQKPTIKRGIPHHTAARMKRNSISAKLRKLVEPSEGAPSRPNTRGAPATLSANKTQPATLSANKTQPAN